MCQTQANSYSRKCWFCGKVFVTDNPYIRYCSNSCRRRHLSSPEARREMLFPIQRKEKHYG